MAALHQRFRWENLFLLTLRPCKADAWDPRGRGHRTGATPLALGTPDAQVWLCQQCVTIPSVLMLRAGSRNGAVRQ